MASPETHIPSLISSSGESVIIFPQGQEAFLQEVDRTLRATEGSPFPDGLLVLTLEELSNIVSGIEAVAELSHTGYNRSDIRASNIAHLLRLAIADPSTTDPETAQRIKTAKEVAQLIVRSFIDPHLPNGDVIQAQIVYLVSTTIPLEWFNNPIFGFAIRRRIREKLLQRRA